MGLVLELDSVQQTLFVKSLGRRSSQFSVIVCHLWCRVAHPSPPAASFRTWCWGLHMMWPLNSTYHDMSCTRNQRPIYHSCFRCRSCSRIAFCPWQRPARMCSFKFLASKCGCGHPNCRLTWTRTLWFPSSSKSTVTETFSTCRGEQPRRPSC